MCVFDIATEQHANALTTTDIGTKHLGAENRCVTSNASFREPPQDRFVKHDYHDHYHDPPIDHLQHLVSSMEKKEGETGSNRRGGARGGVVTAFPERLYTMLNEAEQHFPEVVGWQPHGRCFLVRKPKRFAEEIVPKYFRQSKLTSFQRQVSLYGFRRLTVGEDRGGYYHELFLRGRPDLQKHMVRVRVKGTGCKYKSSPATEPHLYSFPVCTREGPSYYHDKAVTGGGVGLPMVCQSLERPALQSSGALTNKPTLGLLTEMQHSGAPPRQTDACNFAPPPSTEVCPLSAPRRLSNFQNFQPLLLNQDEPKIPEEDWFPKQLRVTHPEFAMSCTSSDGNLQGCNIHMEKEVMSFPEQEEHQESQDAFDVKVAKLFSSESTQPSVALKDMMDFFVKDVAFDPNAFSRIGA